MVDYLSVMLYALRRVAYFAYLKFRDVPGFVVVCDDPASLENPDEVALPWHVMHACSVFGADYNTGRFDNFLCAAAYAAWYRLEFGTPTYVSHERVEKHLKDRYK